jgi:hypothetical protein
MHPRLGARWEFPRRLAAKAERRQLEGIASKRKASPYRSGPCRAWVKVTTATWREANRERWRDARPPLQINGDEIPMVSIPTDEDLGIVGVCDDRPPGIINRGKRDRPHPSAP